jgi:hypothetical protein
MKCVLSFIAGDIVCERKETVFAIVNYRLCFEEFGINEKQKQ